MCTLTFIPAKKSVFITHSRDEKKLRSKATPPAFQIIDGVHILFPKDGKAGGTWIGMNDNGDAAALLNGAFRKHIHQPPYLKSRGLIVLELLSAIDMRKGFSTMDLTGVEPFTVVLWSNRQLFECRWDGQKKYARLLDHKVPHIWSSATLYEDAAKEKRQSWFNAWQEKKQTPGMDDIIDFHLHAGDDDERNNIRMKRNNNLLTLSITSMEISRLAGKMKYIDLADHAEASFHLHFKKAMVESR